MKVARLILSALCLGATLRCTPTVALTPPPPTPTPTCFFPTRPPTPSVSFQIHPETPKVGDVVQVTLVTSTVYNGPPSVELYSASPIFADLHLVSSTTLEMKAVQEGMGRASIDFEYEIIDEICNFGPIYELANGGGSVDITVLPRDTPTPTATPTRAPTFTPTACGVDMPRVDPVTSPTYLLQQTITGAAHLTGARSVCVDGEGGSSCCDCYSGRSPQCCGSFSLTITLARNQTNHLSVCNYNGNYCGGAQSACTRVDEHGNPLDIVQASPQSCTGDCDTSGDVTVDEIIRMVSWALNGGATPTTCPSVGQWCSEDPPVTVTCIIEAVNNALTGCSVAPTTEVASEIN